MTGRIVKGQSLPTTRPGPDNQKAVTEPKEAALATTVPGRRIQSTFVANETRKQIAPARGANQFVPTRTNVFSDLEGIVSEEIAEAYAQLKSAATSSMQFSAAAAIIEAALSDSAATVVARIRLGGGINSTEIVQLSNGAKGVWKSSAGEDMSIHRQALSADHQGRREAAAYCLDKAMGHLSRVQPTVYRELEGVEGAIVAFAEDMDVGKIFEQRSGARIAELEAQNTPEIS